MEILPYKEAKKQYRRITSDPKHRMHGFSKDEFAKQAEDVLGDKRFNTLRGGAINRGLWGLGQFVDGIGQFDLNPWYRGEQSIGSGIGGVLQFGGKLFGADEELQASLMNVGRELPGGLLNFAIMAGVSAVASPLVGVPVGAAFFYGDAYNDALEEGRSVGEAAGSGLLNVAFGTTTGGTGRALGALGRNAATRANQKLVAKQFAAAGISDEKAIVRIGKKIAKQENKWYKPRKGLKVTNYSKPGAPAITIRPASKPKTWITENLLVREAGMTAYGVTADILDTWMFNEQLSVGQLLTDPNYIFPMLAGDGITFIGGDVILNTAKGAGLKRAAKRKAVKARLDGAKKKLLERKGLMRPGGVGRVYDEWSKVTALEDMPDIELIRTENINELGDIEYKWVDTAGMDKHPELPIVEFGPDGERVPSKAGKLTETGRHQAKDVKGVVSYKTDEKGRIFDVTSEMPGDQDLLFMALRRQVGVGMGETEPKFATFEYIKKEDESDRDFIEQVLNRFAHVENSAPGILRISDIHTVHENADARRRAARHMEYWDEMPVSQDYPIFVERYIRAAQMGGIPTSMLRSEARRVFQFYRSKGLGDDMAMRLSLRLVERSGFKTFYDIYYGDAKKTDTDLARVVRQDVIHSGREGSYLHEGWGKEYSDSAGLIFYHDPETRTTLKWIQGPEEAEGIKDPVVKVYRGGVEVNTIKAGDDPAESAITEAEAKGEISSAEATRRRKVLELETPLAKHSRQAVERFGDTLTIDQQSALTLAIGQRNEVATPGVTFGKSIGDNERALINDLTQGLGIGDEGVLANVHRIIVVGQSDLSDPVALREMGMPVLSMYANTMRSRDVGGFITPLEPHNAAEGIPGIYLIVRNDQLRPGIDEQGTPFANEHTLIHEFGHLIHHHITNRPEFDKLNRDLFNAYMEDMAKVSGKKVKVSALRKFASEKMLMGTMEIDPKTGKEKVPTPEEIDQFMKLAVPPADVEYLTMYSEWMAENFYKYTKKKGTPVNTTVERFFKNVVEMWDKLIRTVFGRRIDPKTGKPRALHPSAVPPKVYNNLMGLLQEDFHSKIARRRHPEIVKSLVGRYGLTDKQMEHLSSKLWESDYHSDMLKHVETSLDLWILRGKGANFNEKINQALRDHKRRATMAADPALIDPGVDERKRRDKLNEIFFGMENVIKHGEERPPFYDALSPEEKRVLDEAQQNRREEYKEILSTIDKALFGVYVAEARPDLTTAEAMELGYTSTIDPVGYNPGSIVDAVAKAQSIVVRWLQGELEGQRRGLPREGGTELLRRTIEKTMRSERKKLIDTHALKDTGAFEEGGNVEYFTDVKNADKIASDLLDTYGNEGYNFEVRSRETKTGAREFFIVRIYDEYLSRAQFDEKYTQQNDGTLSSSTSEQMAENRLLDLGHTPEVAGFHANRMLEMVRETQASRSPDRGEPTPTWKIEALKQARQRTHFESFDLHGDQPKAGIWTAALARAGLIENVGQYPSRATKWTITLKGLDALKTIEADEARRGEGGESRAEKVTRMQKGIAGTIKRGTDNKLLPPELLAEIDGVLKELDEAGGQDQLDAIARDLGVESVRDFDELQQLFMQKAFDDPKGTATIISLLPNKTKDFLRGLLTFSIDLAESVEAQVKRANMDLENTGESLSAVEEVKAGLALAAEEKGNIGPMSSAIARLQPGGIKEAEVEGSLWRAPFRWMEKVYNQSLMGLQHLAESHPLIRPAASALYRETGLQNMIYAENTDQFHARIPPVLGDPTAEVDYTTTDKNRSFKVITENPKLGDAYNQLRLLENKRDKGFGELLAAKDEEVTAIFDAFDSTEQQKLADLIQRAHKAQTVLTYRRNQSNQEIDRITAARLLLRKGTGEMASQEALGIIEKLDAELMKGGDDVLERGAWLLAQEAGIDLGIAEGVTMFYARLKGATAELNQFLMSRPYYVSERRMKRFHVSYIEKRDKATSLADFDTVAEAQEFASEVAKGGGTVIRGRPIDTTIQASLRNSGARDMLEVLETATAKRTAVVEEMFRDTEPELADEIIELFDEMSRDVAIEREAQSPLAVLKGGAERKRKFKGGRERFNMLEQQLEHSRRVAVALARKRSDALIALTRQDKDAQSGPGSALMKLVEQAKQNQRNPDPAAGVFMSKFNFAMFLGMNTSSALIEMAQFPLTLTPILMELGAGHAESFTTPVKLLDKAAASMLSSRKKEVAGAGWTDSAHIELIRRAEKENRLNIRRYIDVDDDIVLNNETAYRVGRGEDMRGSLKTWNPFSMAYRLGAKMYAPFNRFNAELSLVSVFEVLRKKNPDMDPANPADFESLYTQSVRWADIANGSAGKSNRPIGLFSGGTSTVRTLAQTSFALMSFTNAAVGNWMRWIKKSNSKLFAEDERRSSRHALAQAAGLHIIGLGAMGLPLTAAINTIFAEVFGFDLEDIIKDALTTEDESGGVNDFWANFALYGAMHAGGLAPDLQTRMAIGGIAGLNPYKGWDALSVLGPSASYAQSSVQALLQAPEQGPGRTLTNLLPVGVRKAVQLTLTDHGQIRDRANRYITTPTEAEKASLLLGFRPGRVRAEQSRVLEIARAEKAEAKQKKRAVIESLNYLRKGDLQSAQQNLIEVSAQQEGSSYSDLYRSLEDRYLTEKFGKGFDAGVVTSSKISSQGFGRESRPTNEQVYRARLGLRGAFGLPSQSSRRELRINQRADQFMQTSPFLNPTLAKKLARSENQTDPLKQPFSTRGFASFLQEF